MKAKLKIAHLIATILYILGIVGGITYVILTRSDQVVDYATRIYDYCIGFFLTREWDVKSYIVVGLLALLVVIEPYWLLVNINKKRKMYSYIIQFALPFVVLGGLLVYRKRVAFLEAFKGNHNAIYVYGGLALVLIGLFLLITYYMLRKGEPTRKEKALLKQAKKRAMIIANHDIFPEVKKEDDVTPVAAQPTVKEPVVEETEPEVEEPQPEIAEEVVEPEVVEKVEEVVPVKKAPRAKKEQPAPLRPKVAKSEEAKRIYQEKYGEIIRRTFVEKLGKAPENIKKAYNEIKAELLSYDVKSRVSKTGESFRYKKTILAKITAQGKIIKINYALDPKAYSNTTIPVQDTGMKKAYAEIPALLKIKSDLSVKRAKLLIADVMKKHDLPQGEVTQKNYAKSLKEVKA